MMWRFTAAYALTLLLTLQNSHEISSPLKPSTTYRHSTELRPKVADLWWTVDATRQEITFELHIKTTGWIALGISPGILFGSKSFVFYL